MNHRRALLTLAALPLLLLPLACAGPVDDATSPEAALEAQTDRDGEVPTEGRRVQLTVPAAHASAEELAALVEFLEGQADVAQAKAAVKKTSPAGDAEVSVELWGQDMPADEALAAAVQAQFPYLAQVDVSPIDVEAEAPPQESADVDPEVLRQQIIDDLHAQGVEGQIDVQITDHPDGRREVEVSVHQDEPPA
ncbi:MAG: hypothetical protein KDK70_13945 [Myxococcales bacterium]|nr:hypothetical protein [Myxococcales bacterium]